MKIPLRLSALGRIDSPRLGEPVTAGVPLPKGALTSVDNLEATTGDGRTMPVQARVMDRWSDGSVRWALVDLQVPYEPGASTREVSLQNRAAGIQHTRLQIRRFDEALSVDTGSAVFRISTAAPLGLAHVEGEGVRIEGHRTELRIISADRGAFRVSWLDVQVEAEGPLRAAVALKGEARNEAGERLHLALRFDFYAGLSTARTRVTVRNPRRAQHPGGIWELGDTGSVLIKELALRIGLDSVAAAHVTASLDAETADERCTDFALHQESSGGDSWQSPNHRNRSGSVPLQFRGYTGHADSRPLTGLRANPIVTVHRDSGSVAAAVPDFWQNFPRSLSADPSHLTVSFFPASSDPQELQGGEQKTHVCYLLFGRDTVTGRPLEWCRAPLVLHAAPEWYEHTQAVPHLVTATNDAPRYRALVNAAIEGNDTFIHKRERADEYGWRHFGDIYGDHEAVFASGPVPLMSHYNNQYDVVGGFLYQFMKTGDVRWYEQFQQLAAHVIDIDIYHTDEDKAAYNHGLFWHTYHYVDAGLANHRSYPRGTVGGGPSSEQNYPTGLMLHHFLTGDMESRDAALGLARFVINMDDGTRTPFRYLARGYTGVASASRTPDYHGPGRGSGNSLNALLDGHRLTGEGAFLDKAEQIIRRCTHPRQNLDSLGLLDPENRWFYTMYLQSLAKYLERKIELGDLDAMYAYGRDVLLHYARWMAAHERPYLDHPELLEYPTETWAAQDIRKSEVFDAAARYATGEERQRFLERAEFFYDYCARKLTEMPTRSLARPVVLLMAHGLWRPFTRMYGVSDAPTPTGTWEDKWPRPQAFVPQKVQARRRVVQLAAAGAGLGILGLALLLL